jgi:hypothetical protein
MNVKELILELSRMPPEAEVAVYESDPDDFLVIGKIEVADNGNQVRLHSQYAVDGDMC